MATLTSEIQALLTYANGVTGEGDTTLGEAVHTLADGYGQGGGDEILKGVIERKLTTIDIPSSVTSIGDYVFSNYSNLQSINIPSSVTSIGVYAFRNCTSLQSINIPSSVTSIAGYVFDGCSGLQSISIQEGLTTIGTQCFRVCSKLSVLEFPSTLKSIAGSTNFYGCNLTFIFKSVVPPTMGSKSVFQGCTVIAIYVPDDSVDAYKAVYGWSVVADLIKPMSEYVEG